MSALEDYAWWCAKLTAPSFVYVVQTAPGAPVKIGTAKDVPGRIAGLQTGNPYPLVLLYVLPGGHELEWQLHQKLKGHRLVGEWFEPEAAEKLFPMIERLGKRMMDAYDDSGRVPPFRMKGFSWRLYRVETNPTTVTYMEPDPVDPEVAAERLRTGLMRRRRKGDTMFSLSRDVTTII